MKRTLAFLISAAGLLLMSSCNATPPPTVGGMHLERSERAAPVTDAPRVDAPSYGDPLNNYPIRNGTWRGGYRYY